MYVQSAAACDMQAWHTDAGACTGMPCVGIGTQLSQRHADLVIPELGALDATALKRLQRSGDSGSRSAPVASTSGRDHLQVSCAESACTTAQTLSLQKHALDWS